MQITGLSGGRSRPVRLLRLAALAAGLAMAGAGAARADCAAHAGALKAALAAQDLAAVQQHYEALRDEPSCPDSFRAAAGRPVSLLHARIAQQRVAAGATLADQQELLERGRGAFGHDPANTLMRARATTPHLSTSEQAETSTGQRPSPITASSKGGLIFHAEQHTTLS